MRNGFDGISFHPLMQISQMIIASRQVPFSQNDALSPMADVRGLFLRIDPLFLPFFTLKLGLDFDGSRHQLISSGLQTFSDFGFQTWDSRAAKTLFRFLQKAIDIGAIDLAAVFRRI
jgi:hypothetical protein